MNVGLMQICTPLSPSLKIFCPVMTKIKYMYTTTRACTPCPKLVVNVTVIMEPILETGVLIRTKSKAYFSFISSRRLLNQENAHARVCYMENFYAMHVHLFFNHWIRVWAGAYHKCHQRRLRRACAFVQSRQGLAAH